jgi:hypothetical protein
MELERGFSSRNDTTVTFRLEFIDTPSGTSTEVHLGVRRHLTQLGLIEGFAVLDP